MTIPHFDLGKIIYSVSKETYQKALKLYESGDIRHFHDTGYLYRATVYGTHPYDVSISVKKFELGDCDCYMGQHDYVCKHMIALALYAIYLGKPVPQITIAASDIPISSGKLGELSSEETIILKSNITHALKYVKGYIGPSRTWSAYQDSLSEGCRRLSTIISTFPVNPSTAKIIWQLLLRLNKKLISGGVDDSDGTVGGFMEACVQVLLDFIKLDSSCNEVIKIPPSFDSSFGWEERLIKHS